MNTSTKTILFFILIVITQLFSNCNKKNLSTITYEGYVYDTIGGVHVSGIKIKLSACTNSDAGMSQCNSYEVGNSTTDSDGHFKIEAKEAKSDRYAIEVNNKPLPWVFSLTKNDLKDIKYTVLYLK